MFPVEIVCAVLESADWRSLLRAKLVCTTWYCATKSRQMWYTFVKELTTDNTMTKIEGRVDDYTVEELERWVITKLRAREAWFSENSPLLKVRTRTFHYRHIGTSTSYYPEFQLLPGGRWAIVCYPGKGIISYDLDSDSPEFEERLLVGPATMDFQLDQDLKYPLCVQIWVDPNNPSISLRMVVKEHKDEVRLGIQLAYIFKIDVVGHGKNAHLNARLLATRKHNTRNYNWYMSTTDGVLAEVWETHSFPQSIELCITPWDGDHLREAQREGNRVKLTISEVIKGPTVYREFILLLSEDRRHAKYINVYSIPQIESHDTRYGPLQPLYRLGPLTTGPQRRYMMQPFSHQGFDWIIAGHGFEFSINQLCEHSFRSALSPNATIRLQEKFNHDSIPSTSCTHIEPTATIVLQTFPRNLVAVKTYEWSLRDESLDFRRVQNMRLKFDPVYWYQYFHSGRLSGVDTGSGRILVSSGDNQGWCFVLDTVAETGGLGSELQE